MRHIKPDPYDGFEGDRERRRALNTRARCSATAFVAIAVAPVLTQKPIYLAGVIRWLMHWFQ
jgi:hypothetical protein